ncbi:hypothetical protein T265_03899 [Opisthorchis viverrini]|uniref:Uncharacterized protein n=1 Tax=Opisthorchis viverrini TaxID=6198 RepID=A0A074ZQL7_OPIVI|nr:hypothetical protein T265_03899 [Opisthorchis viverrini]KER29431.1 hypothetical protein T265_03899 [Opisthorchis viverrini]
MPNYVTVSVGPRGVMDFHGFICQLLHVACRHVACKHQQLVSADMFQITALSVPHGERQPLNDKSKTDPGKLGESLDSVYQSVNT